MSIQKKFIIPPAVPAIDPNQKWFTIAETAIFMRRSVQFVRGLLHSGELRASRVGGYLIERADLDKYLTSRKGFIGAYRSGTRPWVASRLARDRAKRKRAA